MIFSLYDNKDLTLRQEVRFKVVEVPLATPDLLISTFIQGLKSGDFFNSPVKKLPNSFENLLAKSEKYINMEEAQVARVEHPKNPPRQYKENRPESRSGQPPRAHPTALLGQFAAHTPLKMSKARALEI